MVSEWPEVPLKTVSTLITKGTTPTTLGMSFAPYGINFIKAESVTDDGRIDRSKFAFIDQQTHETLKRSQIETDDLLLSMAGVYLGKVAVVPSEVVPANTNQALAIIRLDTNIVNPRFVAYFLRNREFNTYINNLVAQSAQPNLNLSEIGNLPIRLPPLTKQRAIAHILGTLDDKIELNRRMNETLEAMARALFQSWFVDFDSVRAKAEGRHTGLPQHLADLFPDRFDDSELGEIPAGWSTGSILKQAKLLSGGTPKTEQPDYWNGNIPWASAKDVSQSRQTFLVRTERTITSKGLEESATQLIPALGTVIVARGATTGRMVLFGQEMAMNQTCYALVSSTETPLALHCRLQQAIDALVHAAHGSVFDTITTSTFSTSKIVLPPAKTLKAFEQIVSPIFGRILIATEECLSLAALRDTLLPKLISGELSIKDAERFLGRQVL